jgi:hypothetical protein
MATLAPSPFSYKTRLEQRNKSNAVNQGAQAINTILVFEQRRFPKKNTCTHYECLLQCMYGEFVTRGPL